MEHFRSTKASEESILRDLRWMGLHWDEGPDVGGAYGPYRQSERKDIYKKYAQQLVENGQAYYCFSTEEELAEKKEQAIAQGLRPQYDGEWRDASPEVVSRKLSQGDPYTVRFKVPPGATVTIDDMVRGRVTWDADAALGDFILLRSNGMPVYNFCVAVDDMFMKITHVIRAEEHLSNTLRQVLIFNALNYPHPIYAHCSLILGSDRSKLSKRHGAASLSQFASAGYLPESMMNYLANLGWNDGSTKEIYTPRELIGAFKMDRIVKSAAVFDIERLNWINSQHIKALPVERIRAYFDEVLTKNINGTDCSMLVRQGNYDLAERNRLLDMLTSLGQSLITLTEDIKKIASEIVSYPFEDSIKAMKSFEANTSAEDIVSVNNTLGDENLGLVVKEIVHDDFSSIAKIIVRDIDADVIPVANSNNATKLWKDYISKVSAESNRKGKRLFHPLRLALTGRVSGPDVGLQLQILSASAGQFDKEVVQFVSLKERASILKRYLESYSP